MSNLLAVETDPQYQPAECSWGSGDKAVNQRFLRITNPFTDTQTLLMGEIFFKHLASQLGYVHRTEVEEETERLRTELNDVRSTVDSLGSSFTATRESLNNFADFEDNLGKMRDILEALDKRTSKPDANDSSVEAADRDVAEQSDESDKQDARNDRGGNATAGGLTVERNNEPADESPTTRKTDKNAPGEGSIPAHAGTEPTTHPRDESSGKSGSTKPTSKS